MTREQIFSIFISLSQLATGVFLSAVLTRVLGIEGFGVYALVVSTMMILSVLAQIGMPQLLTKETAILVSSGGEDRRGLWRIWNTADRISAGPFLAAGAGFTAWLWIVYGNWLLALTCGVLIATVTFTSLRAAALRGLGETNTGHFFLSVFPYLFAAVSVLALNRFSVPVQLQDVFWIVLLGWAVSVAVLQTRRERKGTGERLSRLGRKRGLLLVRDGLPMMGIAGLAVFNSQIDVIILGLIAGAPAAALYQAALQVTMAFNLLKVKLAETFAHRVAVLWKMGKLEDVPLVTAPVTIVSSLFSGLVFAALLLFGREILDCLFGPGFEDAYAATLIVAGALVLGCASGPLATVMLMTGLQKTALHTSIGSALINLALNPIFILQFGIAGAAMTLFISVAWWNVVMTLKVHRAFGIDVSVLGALKIYRARRKV